MFSKKGLEFVLLSAVFIVASCTPKIGEAPPENTQQKLEGTQCLSDLKPVVLSYAKGEASDAQVVGGWDCASLSIKKFKKYVYGRAEDRYSSLELVKFLEQNFLAPTGPKVSDELRVEFMKFKQLFVGGTKEDLTRDELDKLLSMFEDLKAITLRLNPYMRLISQNWSIANSQDPQGDVKFFENASDEIQAVAEDFSTMIVKSNQQYRLDDFVVFIHEYAKFYDTSWEFPAQAEKIMPVVKKIKRAIAGGDQGVVAPEEWKSFILLGVRGYVQYLRYFYFIQSASETGSGIRLGYLARTVEDLLGAFQDLLAVKPTDTQCGTYTDHSGNKKINSCISKAEIEELLQTFSDVWKEFRVSPKLIEEGVKLKKVYFGGGADGITSQDFERGKKKIATLKIVVERFMPYYPIYSLEWERGSYDDEKARQFFNEANQALQFSAFQLGNLFEDSYDFNDIPDLLKEIDRLYPSENPDDKLAEQIGQYLPLLKDAKNIVFSENSSLVKKTQWARFLDLSSRFYSSYLSYRYFIQNEPYGNEPYVDSFKSLSDQVLALAKDIVTKKVNQTITESEVRLIAKRLVELEVIPKGVSSASIEQIVKVLLNRIFWPTELRLKGTTPNGLNLVSIENIGREIQIWYETEKYNFSISASSVKPADLQVLLGKKLKSPGISPELRVGLFEELFLVSGPVAQTIDKDGHQVISNILKSNYNSKSLSQINLNRSLARLLIRAAIESPTRLERYEGLSLTETQAFFKLVRPFFVEINLLHPDNSSFADSRFRDANIFTAHSNGDIHVNFAEMGDIIGMISSGVKVNSLFRKNIDQECIASGVNIGLDTVVAETCFRQIYYAHMTQYLTGVPEYLKYYKGTERSVFDAFFGNLLKAAGATADSRGAIRLAEGDLTPHVVQYVEMLFARFDANKDSVISASDAIEAFPAFKGILVELTKNQSLIDQKDLLALFTYILRYGQPPSNVSDFLFKWLPWKASRDEWPTKWVLSADRSRIAQILGYISDQVSKNQKALIEKEVEDAIRNAPAYRDHYLEQYRGN